MKLATPTAQGTRLAAIPLPTSATDAIDESSSGGLPPAPDSTNPFAQIQTLDAEIRAIQTKRDQARHGVFAAVIARIAAHINKLLECGFSRAEIAKALALTSTTPKSSRTTSHKRSKGKKGPATFEGWLNLFRKRGRRAYADKHHVNPDEIPANELANIEEEAKTKATAKCSALTSPAWEEPK